MTRVALDSNILVYAELEPDTAKGKRAAAIVKRADRDGVIAVQALGEFLRVVQRIKPTALAAAAKQVGIYRRTFDTPHTTEDIVSKAAELAINHKLQLWDCVICVASEQARAKVLLSEDMQDGRLVGSLRIVNPFDSTNDAALDALIGPVM